MALYSRDKNIILSTHQNCNYKYRFLGNDNKTIRGSCSNGYE
jgi:hypothetical protein